jgi:membrane-bound lytic murein transglycosylase D
LASIARQYHTSPKAIAEVNGLEGEELQADSKIIIPITAGKYSTGTQVAYSHTPTHYRVRHGDTVLSVADDFGVPPDRLRRWNHLKGDQLARGKVLVIYKPVAVRSSEVINSPTRHSRSRHSHRSTKVADNAKATQKAGTQTASSKSTGSAGHVASASAHNGDSASNHTAASLR